MTKVQTVLENNDEEGDTLDNDTDSSQYGISDVEPSNENYVNGNGNNLYLTSWIFKTPLTIKFLVDGSPRYLTYTTNYAPQND